jgi:hypothetical protein
VTFLIGSSPRPSFIFNVEVAELVRHKDLRVMLTITPDLPRRRYTVPDNKNRYGGLIRVITSSGASGRCL